MQTTSKTSWTTKRVSVDGIRIDGGTQPRAELKESAIADYAEAMKAGDKFPPLRVFDDGSVKWLSRGFHRFHAARRAGVKMIECEVVPGERRDAILDGLGDNATHGVQRTNADKRKSVQLLLEDAEWGQWSDREIARRAHVDHKTVGRLRDELSGEVPQMAAPRKVERNGTTYMQNTTNIGRSAAPGESSMAMKENKPVITTNERQRRNVAAVRDAAQRISGMVAKPSTQWSTIDLRVWIKTLEDHAL